MASAEEYDTSATVRLQCDPESGSQTSRFRQARWWMLLSINLIRTAGAMLIAPMVTNLQADFFHGDTSKGAGISNLSNSFNAGFTILVSAQLGKLSDTVGRQPLITLSVISYVLPFACLGFFPGNLYIFFVVNALVGLLGGAATPAAQAYVADCVQRTGDRAKVFGYLGASKVAMGVVMPLLNAFIEKTYGKEAGKWLCFACAGGCAVAALFGACMLPESLPREKRQPWSLAHGRCGTLFHRLRHLFLRRGSFLWDLAVLDFFMKMESGIPATFAMDYLFDMSDADYSLVMAINALGATLTLAFGVKLLQRLGGTPMAMMILGLGIHLLYLVGTLMLFWFPIRPIFFLLIACGTVSEIQQPAMETLVAHGHEEDSGFAFGAIAAVGDISHVVSPLLMGALYQISPAAPFVLAVSLQLPAIAYAIRLRRRVEEAEAQEESTSTATAPPTTSTTDLDHVNDAPTCS